MHVYEHAQQIYSLLLAAHVQAGKPLPNMNDIPKWAESAMLYARAFDDKNRRPDSDKK